MYRFTLRPPRLVAFGAAVAIVLIGVAVMSPKLVWPDQIFPSIEPGHRLGFDTGIQSHIVAVGQCGDGSLLRRDGNVIERPIFYGNDEYSNDVLRGS